MRCFLMLVKVKDNKVKIVDYEDEHELGEYETILTSLEELVQTKRKHKTNPIKHKSSSYKNMYDYDEDEDDEFEDDDEDEDMGFSSYRQPKRGMTAKKSGMNGIKAAGAHTKTREYKELCEALSRVKEELEGFLKYRHLITERNARNDMNVKQYTIASMQEFKHMLLALDDFLRNITYIASPEEKAEMERFFKTITKG